MLHEHFISLKGQKFRYLEKKGDGHKVLFLHGLSDFADQFNPIASRLPEDWHLLALDQRGHGGSWKPDEGYSPIDYSDDINNFLNSLDITSIHIFGHSMGGRNALIFSTRYPHHMHSLILGDIGPDKNITDVEETTCFFNNLPESFQTAENAKIHLKKRKPGYSDGNIDILMKNLEQDRTGQLVWSYSKDACIKSVTESRSRDWWGYLPRVQCPVLLLHVKGSTELSDDVAEKMTKHLPQATYRSISDSGHNFQLERPDTAAEEIQQFILDL